MDTLAWRSTSELNQSSGFTVLELAVVLAVAIILVGSAVPQLMSAIHTAQLRGTANDLSGLIQQARLMAEKQNIDLPVYTGTVETNATGAFIGISGATWSFSDPDVPYANGVTNSAASRAPATVNPGFTPEAAGTTLYFSPRGLPVKSSGLTYLASNGVVFYLTDTHSDWCAVSVSGAGRSHVWTWTGSAWN